MKIFPVALFLIVRMVFVTADELETIEILLPPRMRTPSPSSSSSSIVDGSRPATTPPLSPNLNRKAVRFRQDFQVGKSGGFSNDDLSLLQTLYQRYTVEFAPIPSLQVEENISTKCTVLKQTILNEITEPNWLYVDYVMAYESQYYNVTEYPSLFQNWTTHNLDLVLDQLQLLKFDVSSVGVPKRSLLRTLEPSSHPTFISTGTPPTSFPSPALILSAASRVDDDVEPDASLEPIESSTEYSNSCSNIKVIAVIASVYAVGAIVFAALYIFQKSMQQ